MRKTLYLHAGMHKTGSTSIQHYLMSNRPFFEGHGFHVVEDMELPNAPDVPRNVVSTNCYKIADAVIDPRLATYARINSLVSSMNRRERYSAIRKVNRALSSGEQRRLVLSAEAFSFLRSPRERPRLRRIFRGLDVRPILFFRNKSDWLESWNAQITRKCFKAAGRGRRPAGIFDLTESSWLLDYDRIKAFYHDGGTFLSYDRVIAEDGSVVPAFLRVLGLDAEDCPPWDEYWMNRSSRANPPASPGA